MNQQLAAMLNLWACLRAAHHMYWTLHWQSRGPNFYGDHQLFERLYTGRLEEIDDLAELIAGHYGADKLNPVMAWQAAMDKINTLSKAGSPLAIAQMVLDAAEAANSASASGKFPAGTQNAISTISTNHLTALYLLQQRMGGAGGGAAPAPTAPAMR
jgi:DNA-binding ferritin-like protein